MVASLLGIITIWKQAGSFVEKHLHYLVSFAAGVFLVLVFFLSEEVLTGATSIITGLFWIIMGLISITLLIKILPEGHHHHQEDEGEPHTKLDARRLIIGDSLHNTGDGILLAGAYLTSSALGVAVTVSILFHELIQGISEFFVLKQAGFDTRDALKINFATASTILIGSVGGYFFLGEFQVLEIPVLGIATGALLALLIQDLLPHSLKHAKDKKCITNHILAALVGAIIMYGIFTLTQGTPS